MKRYLHTFVILVCSFASFDRAGAQQIWEWGVTPADSAAIDAQIKTIFGPRFQVQHIVNVDSVKGRTDRYAGAFQDPNGLLTHSYLFTAWKDTIYDPRKGAVGVWKNNAIVWHSPVEIMDDFSGGNILGTYDLTNDGRLEIITTWSRGRGQGIWIYSWDGNSATRINAVDATGDTKVGASDGLEFADVEGDGVWEIQNASYAGETAEGRSFFNLTTYSWNGQYYDQWPSTPQPPDESFYPRDRLDVDLQARADQIGEIFRYRYRIENKPTSIQVINEMFVENRSASITEVRQRTGWHGWGHGHEVTIWVDYGGLTLYPTGNFVGRGQVDSSFEYRSSGLPYISTYYIQGYNSTLRGTASNIAYINYLTNSKKGKTIAPADPPSPFNRYNFLDSLRGYIQQSRTLNWISSQSSTDKYLRLLDSTRVKLGENNIRAARAKLDTVLQQERQDSIVGIVTPEAHAIIKFNTQYLLSQVPQKPIYNLTASVVGNGTISKNPNQADYDSGLVVTLSATPSTNYRFKQWSGSITGTTNPVAVLMNGNKTVTATFVRRKNGE